MSRWKKLGALVLIASAAWAAPALAAQDHGDHAALSGHDVDENEGAASESDHAHGHGDHVPTFQEINWAYGLIGEKEGVEPSLLWRRPGDPIPLLALIINTAILFYLIGRFGGPGIRQGLKDRKQRIAGDIDRAAQMKEEAEEQLAHYEEKLSHMEAEMGRIKKEMAEQAEADRVGILKDASERRAVIERDAHELVKQELAQARQDATIKAVTSAVRAAREQLLKNLNAQDHERLANEFLGSLEAEVKKTEAPS